MMDKDYLLEKWLKNDLTDAEKKAFDELDETPFNQYIIDAAQYFKASQFYEASSFDVFRERHSSHKKTIRRLRGLNPLLKLASAIVIGLGVYLVFFFNKLTHIETVASEKTTIELPDHSKVELNALTTIRFDAENWYKKRALELNGEAFFKVEKGSVFDVITKDGKITVVGTQFNVKQRDRYFEVKCFEGVVKVVSDTIIRELHAGNVFQILHGKFFETKTKVLSPKWIHNISNFEAVPFKEVLAEFERQFNIEIDYNNIDVNRLFTGGFMHGNLENALISVTQPMNMTFEIRSSNLIIIHGKED